MCAHKKVTEPRTRGSQLEALLTWVVQVAANSTSITSALRTRSPVLS